MKKCILTTAILSIAISAYTQTVREKKVLFIIADGIPADVIEKVSTPDIDKIIETGSYTRMNVGGDKGTYNETPTISAVGYNSLLTGTWVNKHHVFDNDIKQPNYHYFNIFRILKEQHPNKKTAIFSSWLDNRTRLVGDRPADAGNIQVDFHFDGYELDTVNFPHDDKSAYMQKIDERVTFEASSFVEKHGPDLSWVYLQYTDDMGHMYGDSPEFYKAVEKLDEQVGKISAAISYRQKNFHEDWLLILTTDHGRSEKDGRGHGGQSPRERGIWMVSNYPGLNNYARQREPAIVDIMPSIANFMGLNIPKQTRQEIDGVPFIGNVSVSNLKVNCFQGQLDLTWNAFQDTGTVKVLVSTSNNFRIGKPDHYELLGEFPVQQKHALVDVRRLPSTFYKIVLEGADNSLNSWVLTEEKNK